MPAPRARRPSKQQTACLALTRDLDLDVTRNYKRRAGDRSALTRLLADAAAGKFSALVIARLDRPGRTIPAAPHVLADLDTAGVRQGGRSWHVPLTDLMRLADIPTATIRPSTCGRHLTR
ncbi:MAG: recombinase family protein [Planctomycetales bacterium]|nr:recombinase family protein [Planctomycetales bacterium]